MQNQKLFFLLSVNSGTITSTDSHSKAEQLALTLLSQGRSLADLQKALDEQPWPDSEKAEALSCFQKKKHSQRVRIGIFLITIGIIMCFFSFVITFIMLQQQADFQFVLYGATGLGGLLLLAGLVMVMG